MTPPIHPVVRDLMDVLDDLSNAAPELEISDVAAISGLQVRLGEIVLQVTEIEAMRREELR